MNLTGEWLINEEFDRGVSSGNVRLSQAEDNTLSGEIFLLENEKGEAPFYIKQTVEGIVIENKVILKGKKFEILNGEKNAEYFLDSWEGQVNSEGDIIGSTIDLNGECGVFIMKKLND